jgi:hypothetical protein
VSVGDLPSIMVFWGGPRSGTNHFRLEFGFICFYPFRLFFRVHSGPVCPFSVRPWKDGLSFCPVETVRLILWGRGLLRLTQNAIFFSWMRLRIFLKLQPSFAAFLRCLFEAGIHATLVPPVWSPLPPHWSVAYLFGAVPRLGGRGSAPVLFLFCHALCGLVGSHEVS